MIFYYIIIIDILNFDKMSFTKSSLKLIDINIVCKEDAHPSFLPFSIHILEPIYNMHPSNRSVPHVR